MYPESSEKDDGVQSGQGLAQTGNNHASGFPQQTGKVGIKSIPPWFHYGGRQVGKCPIKKKSDSRPWHGRMIGPETRPDSSWQLSLPFLPFNGRASIPSCLHLSGPFPFLLLFFIFFYSWLDMAMTTVIGADRVWMLMIRLGWSRLSFTGQITCAAY